MYRDLKVAVVVPAFREEALIATTIRAVPRWVDQVVVVDDASPDATSEHVLEVGDPRVELVRRATNGGVGRAILDGYARAFAAGADVCVVMAGDNQMDPVDLPALLDPIAEGEAVYVKGNRLVHERHQDMPPHRRLGSRLLATLTSVAAEVRVRDSQCGYTALERRAGEEILAARPWERYGYPNDFLITLGRRDFTIAERPVRPVYGTEKSGLRPWHMVTILWVILRRWVLENRLRQHRTTARHLSSAE